MMHRFFEKKDNQPVSMIYENPTNPDNFSKFREQIRRTTEEQKRERIANKGQGKNAGRPASLVPKQISLLGPSTMGSPVKFSGDELGRLNSLYDVTQGAQVGPQKLSQANFSMLPVILPADKIFINKHLLNCSGNPSQEEKSVHNVARGLPKSSNQSSKSLNHETSEKIKGITLNINLSRKVLSIEFDIERNQEEDRMMEEESANQGMLTSAYNDGQKMRLEMGFSNVLELEVFSENNTVKFNSQSWDILEIYQENLTKPIRWMGSNIKRLLGTQLPEGEDTELMIEVCLKSDNFGKSFCSRIQTLDRIV